MNLENVKRREFLCAAGRVLAIGVLGSIFVKLSFNKDENEATGKFLCLKAKSCHECALLQNCGFWERKQGKAPKDNPIN